MGWKQWVAVGIALGLSAILYWGFDIIPPKQQALNKTRALNVEATNVEVLKREAKEQLTAFQQADLAAVELSLEQDSSQAVPLLKELSGKWYEFGYPAISGYYAQEVAKRESSGESWAIAGSTYAICAQRTDQEKVKQYCSQRAIQAFEKALSLDPDRTDYRLNLALVHVDNPPKDNPMKGILMLRDLNREQPDNVSVLNNLGRLAIQTGQYERALERLEHALSVDPENTLTICLLAETYTALNQQEKAEPFARQCAGASN